MTPLAPSDRHVASPGRPRSFDKEAALAAALDVFWRQGYEATSLDDLTQAMGLSRSSFYCCFGAKHACLLAALRAYTDRSVTDLTTVARSAETPRAAVQAMIRSMVDTQDGCRGCLLVNCITELAGNDPEVQAVVQQHLTRIEGLIAQNLAPALPGEAHETVADRARAVVAITIGAITLRKAGVPGDQIARALDQAEGLLPAG
ncbi:TetR/AcrR family transcriptional regulator [Rhodovibrio salinarum]|uniref:TetR/AcrR family transcriptional regulator n=1 Tax=Rhodovibrio salinarum TaxID=1087 RepID=A0A934QJQ0_9PROT|nr:TetR/AcrR family transcriptional regulator [Rhodovibrio salinarum]MBK1698146.1 TetR/AcrR family transcriptional regulator [Rhodovibrio salinarum]